LINGGKAETVVVEPLPLPHNRHGADRGGDLRGTALRFHLWHHNNGFDWRRRSRTMGCRHHP
jgi:hypothetical protein